MKKNFLYTFAFAGLLSSCGVMSSYERSEQLPTDSLYRDTTSNYAVLRGDTANFGNMPWQEVFTDPQLAALINRALEANTDLLSAEENIKQAEAGLSVARLAYLPSFALSPQGTLSSFDGGKATKTYTLPIQANWQIGAFGSLRNSRKQAEMTLEQVRVYKQATRTAIIATTANMYYSLQMLDEQLRTTKENILLWEKNIAAMEAMMEAGRTNAAAVSQTKAAYYQILGTVPTLEESIRKTENSICTLLRQAPGPIARSTFGSSEMPAQLSAGVPAQLLSNRPDVRAAELQLAYAFYGTNKARSSFYPSLTISGNAGWTNSAGSMILNPAKFIASAIGSLTQPLFLNGQLRAQLKIAKSQQEQARLSFEQSLLNAGEEVSNALCAYQTANDKEEIGKKQVEQLEKAVESTEYLFNLDSNTSYLETLTARQNLLQGQLSLISTRFDKYQAAISLYQALGGGRE